MRPTVVSAPLFEPARGGPRAGERVLEVGHDLQEAAEAERLDHDGEVRRQREDGQPAASALELLRHLDGRGEAGRAYVEEVLHVDEDPRHALARELEPAASGVDGLAADPSLEDDDPRLRGAAGPEGARRAD